ncbi:NAD(P)H-dependent oxidoreductase [Pectinatus haikarae]|uniref:Nitroreductase n=1 Tax=Pectinatus haikarae TaxID=349096 RepID=A0ABT9Y6B0_9FIRM|nr:NAD(P)H-dependent oxidoreductase [Pectinatus haikarae]MDQ0203347.1 nitroreductase [Pectinatus haikarae]
MQFCDRQFILDTFNFRHACKHFDKGRKVSAEDFAVILEAGRLSPSSFGFEPWSFLVVENRQLKDKLWNAAWGAQNSFKGASHFVILLARKKIDTVYDAAYIKDIMKNVQNLPEAVIEQRLSAFENFQRKDFNLLESERAIFDWASKQTYIALADMLTAAAALGIDSCPIEGFDQKEVDQILSAEGVMDKAHFGVSVMAGFGYRMAEPHSKTRRKTEDVVKWIE